MKFKRIRAGEYCAPVRQGTNIWVARKGHRWVWFLGGFDPRRGGAWETDDSVPFASLREAIKDAVANCEDFLD